MTRIADGFSKQSKSHFYTHPDKVHRNQMYFPAPDLRGHSIQIAMTWSGANCERVIFIFELFMCKIQVKPKRNNRASEKWPGENPHYHQRIHQSQRMTQGTMENAKKKRRSKKSVKRDLVKFPKSQINESYQERQRPTLQNLQSPKKKKTVKTGLFFWRSLIIMKFQRQVGSTSMGKKCLWAQRSRKDEMIIMITQMTPIAVTSTTNIRTFKEVR